ncbi:MAG: type I glyceraldehyde-3-phosphate dehydrogenase [Deltaproteobacteria bacterium]|nr:type I glyceraldehyde-3-phosphate dehydrogenase [Deltaproteobacteria bacterium]
MANVAINGMGRIGRAAFKIILDTPGLELVAVNDLVPADNIAYMLKYDSVYGRYPKKVSASDKGIVVDGKTYLLYSEKDPANLPWKDLGVDVALECTGVFTNAEGLKKHLSAGARKAVLSAPAQGGGVPHVVYGVNEPEGDPDMVSCASCTTNCIAPVVEVMGRRIGVKKATMTTVHAYTSSQAIVDGPSKKWRRGRAGAANLVPTTTGAAKATTLALPRFENRFDGVAVRAPVICGSIADIVLVTEKKTSVDEVNAVFREEAATDRYKGVMGVSEDHIVSSDILQDSHGSLVDLTMTQVVDGDLVKVLSWYDNEWGYSNQMVRQARRMAG